MKRPPIGGFWGASVASMGWPFSRPSLFYAEVTIASGEVSSDLTDFPVYVNLADMPAAFWTHVKSDGGDIRVKLTNGTAIPFDLVEIDTVGETGTLFFKRTVAAASDTVTRIHYGDATLNLLAVDDANGRNQTWSTYHTVHLFTGDLENRTGRTDVAVATGSVSYVDFAVGGGIDFASLRLQAENAFTGSATITLGVIANADTLAASAPVPISVGAGGSTNSGRRMIQVANNGNFTAFDDTNGHLLYAGSSTTGVTYHMDAVWNGSTHKRLFINGAQVAEDTTISTVGSAADSLYIGAEDTDSAQPWDGKIGFAYTANAVLSNAWLAAKYSNISAPTSFYTIGAEVASA